MEKKYMNKIKNPKLIFFTDSITPLKDATSRINQSLMLFLNKKYDLEIICPYIKSNIIFPKNIVFRRIIIPFVKTRNIFKKIVKFSIFSIFSLLYLIIYGLRKDIIVLHTSPPTIIPFLIIPIRFLDFFKIKIPKLFLIAHDLYPDILFQNSNNKFFYYLISKIFKFCYLRFDKIISCCSSINDKLHDFYDINDNKLEIIYCSSLIPKNLILENHKIMFSSLNNKKPKLLLMGNIGLLHLPLNTIFFVRKLLSQGTDIELHTYISGEYSLHFKNALSNLINFKSHSLIDPDQIPKIFKEPTVTLVPLTKAASDCAFPSRISTALSLGSPILLITDILKNNYLVSFIERFKIGKAVLINSDGELIIESFLDLAINFKIYSENSFKTYKNLFQEEENFQNLVEIINKTTPR